MSDDRKAKYRVLAVRIGEPLPDDRTRHVWTIEVQPEGQATQATKRLLQVEGTSQEYPQGHVVELCPDWLMTPDPA